MTWVCFDVKLFCTSLIYRIQVSMNWYFTPVYYAFILDISAQLLPLTKLHHLDSHAIPVHLYIHYNDVMGAIASRIASLTILYSIVYSGTDQRKHQSSASLAFVQGIHRWPVNSLHKWPVTQKIFPFDDVIMRFSKSRPAQNGSNSMHFLKRKYHILIQIFTFYSFFLKAQLMINHCWFR